MSSKLSLGLNDNYRWEVTDNTGKIISEARTKHDAILLARTVSDENIWDYEGDSTYIKNPEDDKDVYTLGELLDELSYLAGMRITKIRNDKGDLKGYKMGLRE